MGFKGIYWAVLQAMGLKELIRTHAIQYTKPQCYTRILCYRLQRYKTILEHNIYTMNIFEESDIYLDARGTVLIAML
jgi:hypothetical protein